MECNRIGMAIAILQNNIKFLPLYLALGIVVLLVVSTVTIVMVMVRFLRDENQYINDRKKALTGQYYRNIPYDGSIEDIFYITNRVGDSDVMRKTFGAENVIVAMFLKWINNGTLIKEDCDSSSFILVQNHINNMGKIEEAFYGIIEMASGNDRRLADDELGKWVNGNIGKYKNFVQVINQNSEEAMVKKGFASITRKGSLFQNEKYEFTEKGKELVDNIIMFRNYLMDFSIIGEREIHDVKLWDKFMIFAGLYGITRDIRKDINKSIPIFTNNSSYDSESVNWAVSYTFSNVGDKQNNK